MREKKVDGRKRHVAVDTLGLVWIVLVTVASVQDRDGGRMLLQRLAGTLARVRKVFADGGYAGQLVDWVKRQCGWILQTMLRPADQKGFQVLPKRWIVERTFAWLMRYRRLTRDYERQIESSEAMVQIAMIHPMLRRLRT